MKRGLVLIVCGLASTLLVSGCGGGGGGGGAREAESAVEQIARWAGLVDTEAEHVDPVEVLHFHPEPPPLGDRRIAVLAAIAAEAGARAKAVGRELTDAFAGTPAQKKHLVCYVTIKELDGEMPRDPAELLADVAEYFGEEFIDEAAYLHYLAVTKRYLDEVETIEEHGIVSANTSLATVCNT